MAEEKGKKGNDDKLPSHFFCPITHDVMKEPVRDKEGNCFEKAAIEEWLKKEGTSPLTRTKMSVKDLTQAEDLKKEIAERTKGMDLAALSALEIRSDGPLEPLKLDVRTMPVAATPLSDLLVDSSGDGMVDVVLHARVTPPNGRRTPLDVCCVVDVSGSMQSAATVKNDTGNLEDYGLSILDVVKHAVKTIIRSLSVRDRFALVTFSSNAKVVFELGTMNEGGKKRAEHVLEGLTPSGSTNLWDGLFNGMELLRKRDEQDRLGSCLLLTDGMPNIEPPRGHIPTLQRYKDKHQFLSCAINTFGFGYSIDSVLLSDIAVEGNGTYSFIPDSGFVGTAFVNSTSNLLCTYGSKLRLLLECEDGVEVRKTYAVERPAVLGGYLHDITNWGVSVDIGTIRYGQTRDAVVILRIPEGLLKEGKAVGFATLKYETHNGKEEKVSMDVKSHCDYDEAAESEAIRLLAVELMEKACKLPNFEKLGHRQAFSELVKKTNAHKTVEATQALMKDMDGQVVEALSRADWFKKWGRHYLPSLRLSHQQQLCSNFKDPGLQVYGGNLFHDVQDQLDALFLSLPAPKPSRPKAVSSAGSGRPAKKVSMSTYYSSRQPCFDGRCRVQMADGTTKPLAEVQRGDVVCTSTAGGREHTTTVRCMVRTACPDKRAKLVQLGDLLVTEFHPIRIEGTWHFPVDLAPARERECEAVYSFVLEDQHVMVIEDVECVGLGHGIPASVDPVVAHPYLGTQRIIDDLAQQPGWEEGLIRFHAKPLLYDPSTELICGLSQ
eukprot:CAMPEP_0119125336 /NCGR_PEP_ID=MMETSP1310-20130426/4648_1 /TAXON_ID=464262 /ORGANISM="Genus nov. species nov., Strain RCC2339" /LENGTH=774 /DNA_ID=CAMNT_0007115395 /DNA_START=27 /DNA_END=2351 /DNA_ORIENTATION=-